MLKVPLSFESEAANVTKTVHGPKYDPGGRNHETLRYNDAKNSIFFPQVHLKRMDT